LHGPLEVPVVRDGEEVGVPDRRLGQHVIWIPVPLQRNVLGEAGDQGAGLLGSGPHHIPGREGGVASKGTAQVGDPGKAAEQGVHLGCTSSEFM